MKFDLQVDNRTFEIRIVFSNHEGYLFDVYEYMPKKHKWSYNKKYLFRDVCVIGGCVKEEIVNCINGYLAKEKIYNNFIEQITELSK